MSDQAAKAGDWKTEPFGPCILLPYRASYTKQEAARLKKGLIPQGMEDRWFIYFDDGMLHFHRSWIGLGVYKIRLIETETGLDAPFAYLAESLSDNVNPEFQGRILHNLVCNLLLGQNKPFPVPE